MEWPAASWSTRSAHRPGRPWPRRQRRRPIRRWHGGPRPPWPSSRPEPRAPGPGSLDAEADRLAPAGGEVGAGARVDAGRQRAAARRACGIAEGVALVALPAVEPLGAGAVAAEDEGVAALALEPRPGVDAV